MSSAAWEVRTVRIDRDVALVADVAFPRSVSIAAESEEFNIGAVVEATLDDHECRYRVSAVCVGSTPLDATDVDANVLRRIPVRRILADGLSRVVDYDAAIAWVIGNNKPRERTASIYRIARAMGRNPTQSVAIALDVAPSTANKMVMRERSLRRLRPTTPGSART